MYTSYFALMSRHPELAHRVVGIARGLPKWFEGRSYPALAPSWKLVHMGDHAAYEREYKRQVLDHLDPSRVVQDLGDDAILLCWEKPGEFCHRRLVAAWLEESLGIEVPEWGYDPAHEPKKKPEPPRPVIPQVTQRSLF